MRAQEFVTEKWSAKYKRSINCDRPRGFSQRAHCAGRKKKANEATDSDHKHSVKALEKDLKNPGSYDAIDHMMTAIAQKHNITPKKLHDLFVEKHGVIPDKWTRQHLDELQFLGSQCTKDCSGHRAGYQWYKAKRRTPNSHSPSFNNGAALAAAGR